ncbi:MAG: M14 family metallopeptidase [Opitutaceae bacterium]
MTNRVNVDQLLVELRAVANSTGFSVDSYGEAFGYPLLVATRSASMNAATAKRVYISTGIHGDEPAPPQALLELLRADALPHSNHYVICLCMNPAGLAAGTRENPDGIDLNRDYTDFVSTEISSHRQWIETQVPQLDLAIHLHEDWEAQGFYFYELNFDGRDSRAEAILAAAKNHLPIELASRIDGHRARGGVIRPPEIPDLPEGLPEAIYFQKRYKLLNYTLETPSGLDIAQRISAMQAALLAAIG